MEWSEDFKNLGLILIKIWDSFDFSLKCMYLGTFGLILSLIGYGMRYIIERGF